MPKSGAEHKRIRYAHHAYKVVFKGCIGDHPALQLPPFHQLHSNTGMEEKIAYFRLCRYWDTNSFVGGKPAKYSLYIVEGYFWTNEKVTHQSAKGYIKEKTVNTMHLEIERCPADEPPSTWQARVDAKHDPSVSDMVPREHRVWLCGGEVWQEKYRTGLEGTEVMTKPSDDDFTAQLPVGMGTRTDVMRKRQAEREIKVHKWKVGMFTRWEQEEYSEVLWQRGKQTRFAQRRPKEEVELFRKIIREVFVLPDPATVTTPTPSAAPDPPATSTPTHSAALPATSTPTHSAAPDPPATTTPTPSAATAPATVTTPTPSAAPDPPAPTPSAAPATDAPTHGMHTMHTPDPPAPIPAAARCYRYCRQYAPNPGCYVCCNIDGLKSMKFVL